MHPKLKFLSLIFLFILLSVTTHAQVVIKEKVEIKPQTILNNSPETITQHIFTYKLTWTPSEYHRGNIKVVTCEDDTLNSGPTTSGVTTISITGNGRHYFLFEEERYFYHNFFGWGWYSDMLPDRLLQVFVDGVEKYHPQDFLGGYDGVYGNFTLDLESFFCSTDHANLSMPNTSIDWAECNAGASWLETDPVNLQLMEGAQYATLYNTVTGVDLGNSTILNHYSEIENIVIKPNPTAPFVTTPQLVTLEVNINGVMVTSETAYIPEVFILRANAYPNRVTTGEQAYLSVRFTNFCTIAPSDKKINAEIIKGQEYGSLINPYTSERCKTLNNLDHWYGSVGIDYIADGKSAPNTDTVIIKFSSNDPSIAPKLLSIYINPPLIYVYTNPAELSTSDTAEVIIKKRNPDGTLEDFPPGQTFELAVTDECVNGNILVDTTLNIYFANAVQPIYFVTADSIEGESGYVRLRVGTDLGGGSSRPLGMGIEEEIDVKQKEEMIELRKGYAQMIEEKKKEMLTKINNEVNNSPIESPLVSACYIGSFIYNYGYWFGDRIIKEPIIVLWDNQTKDISTVPQMPDLNIKVIPNASDIPNPYIVTWGLEVKWISKQQSPDKTFKYTFYDRVIGESREGVTLEIPDNDNTIVGGDQLTLTVSIGDHSVTKKLKDMKILGVNGQNNVQMVKNYINAQEFPQPIDLPLSEPVTLQDQRKQMQVIVDIESSFFQFLDTRYEFMPHGPNDIGYPNMNPNPHDWGLSQLSVAEPSLGVIWNWKTNINAGIHFLWGTDPVVHKFAQVKNKFNEIKGRYTKKGIVVRDPNREEFLKMLAQHYHKGYYYTDYVPGNPRKNETGSWKETDKEKWKEYGLDFWTRFEQ